MSVITSPNQHNVFYYVSFVLCIPGPNYTSTTAFSKNSVQICLIYSFIIIYAFIFICLLFCVNNSVLGCNVKTHSQVSILIFDGCEMPLDNEKIANVTSLRVILQGSNCSCRNPLHDSFHHWGCNLHWLAWVCFCTWENQQTKWIIWHSKDIRTMQQQWLESSTITLTCHASKCKAHQWYTLMKRPETKQKFSSWNMKLKIFLFSDSHYCIFSLKKGSKCTCLVLSFFVFCFGWGQQNCILLTYLWQI